MKDKLTIHFYNKDIWISYIEEKDKHAIHLRVPYGEVETWFVPDEPHDMSEIYTKNPLKLLRVGYLHERIMGEETKDDQPRG